MYATNLQRLGQARLDDMHSQAQRDALARAARRTHRAQRHQSGHHGPSLLGALTRRTRRPGLEPESL